jgi:hypothetical protein
LWTPEFQEVFGKGPWEMWDYSPDELQACVAYLRELRKAAADGLA